MSRAIARPWWLAAIIIGLGLLCIYGAASLPAASRYAGIGPGAFPTFIGAALVILGIILAIQIARGEDFRPQEAENADTHAPVNHMAFAYALAAAALPILTIKSFGLPLTATVSFALVARSFGSPHLLRDLLTGVIVGCLAWGLFHTLGLQLGSFLPVLGI